MAVSPTPGPAATSRSPPPPDEVLATVQADRFIVQEFRPLADSLEWELGQLYLRERGNKAFLRDADPVPFTVNNDGTLSAHAAEVLFANLAAAERAGDLEPDIFALELGPGVGLFARYFLDAFRTLCARRGKDYYDRLCYVAADRSAAMLLDACRHGVFADHPGRYLLRVADALCPERDLAGDAAFGPLAARPFRAVFLNYLLDCLPAAVLRVEGDGVRQLCVRTCLARGVNLADFTDLRPQDLARLADADDPAARRRLLDVFGLLAAEYTYRPVDPASLPYGDFAVAYARSAPGRAVLHNYGAIQCLERLLGLLRPGGLILVNDYGDTLSSGADDFQHQRFSHATFVGLHFPLLKAYFTAAGPGRWVEPAEAGARVHARLLGNPVGYETAACFQDQFGPARRDWLQEPAQRARADVQAGRLEAALGHYRLALERQPANWVLMHEVAQFLAFTLRRPAAGLELTRTALARNPTCSADLWNVFGDCLFALGRVEEARRAFQRALTVNPDDVRARYNLTFVHHHAGEDAAALQRVAEGLALDRAGAFRERLLQKQSEVLARLTQRHQQEVQRLADRVSTAPDRRSPP